MNDARNKTVLYAQNAITNRNLVRQEHLVLLAMLYGYYFDQGSKSFNDFKKLRMRDIDAELRIRTQVLTNEIEHKRSKQRALEKTKKAKEIAVLEALRQQSGDI